MPIAYTRKMQFPDDNLSIPNIVKKIFLELVNNLITVKIHQHNSQITRKIYSNTHDYCEWKDTENCHFLHVWRTTF